MVVEDVSARNSRLGMQNPDLERVAILWEFLVGAIGIACLGRRGAGVLGGAENEADSVGLAAGGAELAGAEREDDSGEGSAQRSGVEHEEDRAKGAPGIVRGPAEAGGVVDAVGPVVEGHGAESGVRGRVATRLVGDRRGIRADHVGPRPAGRGERTVPIRNCGGRWGGWDRFHGILCGRRGLWRWCGWCVREHGFVENKVPRHNNTARGEIIASIPLMFQRVAQENATC